MKLRSLLALTMIPVAAASVGCVRAPIASTERAPVGLSHALSHADREPCDPEIVRSIDPRAAVSGMRPQPPIVRDGPDKPGMLGIDSPNRDPRKAGPSDISAIVLHHTASPADAKRIGMFFSKPSSAVSSHYVVGKDGLLVQCVPDSHASWHAGKSVFAGRDNVNQFSIGIEICNVGDGKDDYPGMQYQALGSLMAYLMTHYKLSWSQVTRHRDVAIPLGRKTDTSDNFDMRKLHEATAVAGGPPAPGAGLPAFRVALPAL